MFQELVFITAATCQSGQCPKAPAETVKVKNYEVTEVPAKTVFMAVEPVRVRRSPVFNLFGRRNDTVYFVPFTAGTCGSGKCK